MSGQGPARSERARAEALDELELRADPARDQEARKSRATGARRRLGGWWIAVALPLGIIAWAAIIWNIVALIRG